VERLKAAGASLVVTVDCGITAHSEVEFAASCGIDVIVIDHHAVPVSLPNAVAVINPHREDCAGSKHLCAAGVVFNVCMALRRALREAGTFNTRPEPNLRGMLDLVALATVADVMPLIEENRLFVQQGLQVMKESRRFGFKALLDVAGIEQDRVNAGSLGFHLGPRINAAGRLEDALEAVRLLRSQDKRQALSIAQRLDEQNNRRKSLEAEIVQEAVQEIKDSSWLPDARILLVANEKWHPGVVGIVASRLVERFARPAIVIGEGGKGSGRSIPSFHLHEALVAVKHELLGFGGHAHAVGLHVDMSRIEQIREALTFFAAGKLNEEDLCRVHFHDGDLRREDINFELANLLSKAEPFGRGNPEPIFKLNHIKLANLRVLRGGHVRAMLSGTDVSVIAFGMESQLSLLEQPVDVLAALEINRWQGRESLQLRIKDVRALTTG
jgi:single-stranded-DNA-specific exonuclease